MTKRVKMLQIESDDYNQLCELCSLKLFSQPWSQRPPALYIITPDPFNQVPLLNCYGF